MLGLVILLSLASLMTGKAENWRQVQQSRDFLDAKKNIADYLPDMAIPKIEGLLARPTIDDAAKTSLLALLGEAQVRAGIPGTALKTLDNKLLREFSPAHLWRSYALVQLGRYRDAIGELEKIDRRTMLENANLQTGKLLLSLGDLEDARVKLEPLLKSKEPSILKEATLQLLSVSLSQNRLDDATELLEKYHPNTPVEEGLESYLGGRLDLAKGDRLPAVGAFQTLLNEPGIRKNLPAALLHESTLALADSLALDGNEAAAVASLLETLETYPDSPKLEGIFNRLRAWAEKIDTTDLIAKLTEWAPLPKVPSVPGIRRDDSTQAGYPISSEAAPSSRTLYSLGFLAGFHLRSDQIDLRRKGRIQNAQLQLISTPGSHLLNRALLELGILETEEKRFEQALTIFSLLEESNATPIVRAYAKSLAAKVHFIIKDPTRASQLFLEAQEIAREIRETELSSLAALNAGITLLTTSRSKELDEITKNLDSPEARSFLILERGLFLSSKSDLAARDFLLSFLANFPANPRTPEASLALAESAVFTPPFDRELAKKHIAAPLKFDLQSRPKLEARRILVLLALKTGILEAQGFLIHAPDHPLAARILFQLSQTYRDPAHGEIGKANQQFENLIVNYPNSEYADAARYYSALTSIALKTETADKKAIDRFRELIDQKGFLANEAAINLCSLLINRENQETALLEISNFLQTPKLPKSDRRRLLILGADAANQIGRHEKAISFYEDLLKIKDLPISTRNRANYIRGQALEKLGRTVDALEAYYEVINRNFDPEKSTSLEWKWFDMCGIDGALALLQKEKRWKAAIQLAEKIGRSGSNRAEEALEISERIGQEQSIYRGRRRPDEGAADSNQ